MATRYYGSKENEKKYRDAQRAQAQQAQYQDAKQQIQAQQGNRERQQQQQHQQQREAQAYQNKASIDERNSMGAKNRENARQNHEDYTNRGYNKAESAFNKGRSEGVDRMTGQRLANQRALNDRLNRIDRYGQNMQSKMSKNVPSTKPGDSGREWEDHKYIDKVETKTGKIRYIYDVGPSGGTDRTSRQGQLNTKKGKEIYDKREKERLANRSPMEVVQDTARDARKAFDKGVNDAKKMVDKGIKDAGKAASDGAKAVGDLLKSGLSNTPLSSLFEPKTDSRLTEMQETAAKNRRPI